MSPEEFIKKHITDALTGEGFPEQVAVGGGWSELTTTVVCHRQVEKAGRMTTVSTTHASGQQGRQLQQSGKRARKSREEKWLRPACSDFAITILGGINL